MSDLANAAAEPALLGAGQRSTPPATPMRKPTLVIEPKAGWSALDVRELWRFRDLMMSLASRDLKLRYKQTVLGIAWVVLQPLLAAGIFSFVFGVVANLSSDGLPYFVFSYAGMLAWSVFSSTITRTSGCLVGNSQLISKVFFPRMVLPLSVVPGVLIDLAIGAAVMVVLMAIFRVAPTPALLTLPLWIVALLLLSQGIGLLTAALAVSYRDVNYILPVIVQSLFFVSLMAAVDVPVAYRQWFYLNPLAALIEGGRWSILGLGTPHWGWAGYALAIAVASWLLGSFSFKRMERKFADVI